MTLRHLKIWKRRSSVGAGGGIGLDGRLQRVGSIFRSPSSDSGYSDVAVQQAASSATAGGPAGNANPGRPARPPSIGPGLKPAGEGQGSAWRRVSSRLRRAAALGGSCRRTTAAGTDGGGGLLVQDMVSVEAFFDFVRRRDTESIQYALRDADFDIDSQDADGRTALHVAIIHGVVDNDMDIVRLLINYGANVNVKDETPQRESALHVALRFGHVGAIQLVLESPTFDVVRCDALQKTRMLPECCVIDDVYKPLPADSDSTLTKRRSFGDQYMLFTRQDTSDYIENNFPSGREPIRDMIVVQDEHLPPLSHLLRRLELQTLTTLYIVDCRLMLDDDCLSSVSLRTLVLSQTHLRVVPSCVFNMTSLEVLKLDRNCITEIPADIGRLTSLRTLSVDSQRPRLRSLPVSGLSRLTRLEVLSFGNNRISDVAWIPGALPRLRVLRCVRNCVARLPASLGDLRELTTLDVAHNRIERVPPQLAPLVRRLYRFEFFNLTLRPRHVRRSRTQLLAHLDLENFLQTLASTTPAAGGGVVPSGSGAFPPPPPPPVVSGGSRFFTELLSNHNHRCPTPGGCGIEEQLRPPASALLHHDVTVAVVGESHAGKATLLAALKDEHGVCRPTDGRPHQPPVSSSAFEVHQFEMRGGTGSDVMSSSSCHVCALVLANDVLDTFSKEVSVDLFLLVVDLTALELHNGSHHLFARHVTRLQMWLQALHEVAADTPVLLVGTHAEQVRAMSFGDIWRILDELLDQSRVNHCHRYSDSRHPYCLLCCPRSLAVRQALSAKSSSRSASSSTSSSAPGFVDLSFQLSSCFSAGGGGHHRHPTAGSGAANSTSGSDTPPTTMNGHVTSMAADSPTPPPGGGSSGGGSSFAGAATGNAGAASRFRFPHVVGYYETDSRKPFPKDAKKSNVSIDQLKSAIVRLATHGGTTGGGLVADGIPGSWMAFARHIAAIKEQAPNVPCIGFDEVVSIARSFDISPSEVCLMLQYFHRRGRLVFFADDPLLSRLVVVNPTWFVQTVCRAVDGFERSLVDSSHLLQCLADKELDRQLQKAVGATVSSAQWLLAALQRLDLCLSVGEAPTPPGCSGSSGAKLFVLPNLLEYGSPSQDVWPDVPEWDEKQITCDFRVRAAKPALFTDFLRRLNSDGRRLLEIVPDPVPVFLSNHVVFFTGIDLGGCEDCCNVRRRLRSAASSSTAATAGGPCGGASGRKPLPPSRGGGGGGASIQVVAGLDDCSGECSAVDELQDDVMHKVHIQLHSGLDAIRIQVRGVSPCCTMKAVLNFLELYLDDVPDDQSSSYNSETSTASSDRASLNSMPASAASPSGSGSDRGTPANGGGGLGLDMDDDDRQFFLLCPKCVLLRHARPERIQYQAMTARRKAICSRWHNLGSWSRAATGDYRYSTVDLHHHLQSSLTSLPEYEHPRLVLVLPPSHAVSNREWYMFSRLRFLEGFEAHFLCENPAYWHLTDETGYRLHQSARFVRRVGNQLPALLSLALPMIQVVQGVNEHAQTCRLIAPVVADLVRMYDYLRAVDTSSVHDPYAWLSKNKDRVVTMLTKVLANASDGLPDLYFKAGSSISSESLFQSPSRANRSELARFLRVEAGSGRFGALRPLYVGREIRWVCDAHYEELRSIPSK